MKILKSNKKVLVSEELINKKNHFLFNCGSFRIFYSTFTKRSDFKKIAAYVHVCDRLKKKHIRIIIIRKKSCLRLCNKGIYLF